MLDQDIVNLAKAIRQHETGNREVAGASGELASRYQYLPSTWKSTAKKYLGDENAPITLENENKATYLKLKDWKAQGYNPAQIASMWNSGSPEWEGKVGVNKQGVKYDTPAYVKSVYDLYQKNKAESQPKPIEPLTTMSGITKFTGQESPLESVSKMTSNIIPSAVETGVGVLSAINPANTARNLLQLPLDIKAAKEEGVTTAGFLSSLVSVILPDWLEGGLKAGGGAISSYLTKDQKKKSEYLKYTEENLKQAEKALVENPFGEALNTVLLSSGFRGAAVKPTTPLRVSKPSIAGEAVKGVTSQLTGLKPETIETVIKYPEKFTAENMIEYGRKNLADDIAKRADAKIAEKSETGKGYEVIRQSGDTVIIPEKAIRTIIEKDLGLKIEPRVNGGFDLLKTIDTKPISPGILNGLQAIIDQYGMGGKYTSEQFLNLRENLSNLRNYDKLNPTGADIITGRIRTEVDKYGKEQIKGLQKLDEQYRGEIQEYKQIKSDLLQKDKATGKYIIKENITSKLINATNKGREAYLRRLEELRPGITEEINIVRALEDIQRASGQKVGIYASRILPTAAGGALGGFGGAVIGFIMSQPAVFIPILRGFGKAASISKASIESIVNKVTQGKPLTATEKAIIRDSIMFMALQIPKKE